MHGPHPRERDWDPSPGQGQAGSGMLADRMASRPPPLLPSWTRDAPSTGPVLAAREKIEKRKKKKELTHWKRPWCWEGLGAGGEGDNRGWDGWMASTTQWTWVWVNSGCCSPWGHKESDMTEQLNWTRRFFWILCCMIQYKFIVFGAYR